MAESIRKKIAEVERFVGIVEWNEKGGSYKLELECSQEGVTEILSQ